MLSTALWVAWVTTFAVLEYVGLKDPNDTRYTLTNRVRRVMASSPAARIVARGAIAVGLAWLTWHFLGVDPVQHPGAWLLPRR
jgi:hypothetical protein